MSTPLFRSPATGTEDDERPKPRRSKKPPVQKRQPQRGLGVAQLERLRLQERWKKIAEMGHSPDHPQLQLPVYDYGGLSSASVGYTAPSGEPYLVQRQPLRGAANPLCSTGAVQYLHPLIHEQYLNLQVGLGAGGGCSQLPCPVAYPELSSNQTLQCYSDGCDLCLKKRALGLSERLGFAERFLKSTRPDPFPPSQATATAAADPKEYDFFPNARNAGEENEHGGTISGGAERLPHLTNVKSIDLSLKLSL